MFQILARLFLPGLFWLSAVLAAELAAQNGPPDQRRSHLAVQGSVKIDGNIDAAWSMAPATRTTRIVEALTELQPDEVAWAQVRCLWDDQHLYVLAQVTDRNKQATNGAPWEQDSFEILLDENCQRSSTYQPDDSQYRIAFTGAISVGQENKYGNIEAKVQPTQNGYRIEAKIKLDSIKPDAGMELGIDFQVNNDDGAGRRQSLVKWSDTTDDSWQNTSRFGTLLLGTREQVADWPADEEKIGDRKSAGQDHPPAEADSGDMGPLTDQQRVPGWAQDAVFYQLFPERFRNGDPTNDPDRKSLEFPDIVPSTWNVTSWTGQWYARAPWEKKMGTDFYENGVFHRRYGGDLKGVIDKLDYLSSLGINVIYFNPVFYARSLHKYDGNSFHHIDPHFGPDPKNDFRIMSGETADPGTWQWTEADKLFLELIEQAHERNIRIIIDGVFNHTGRDFFAFADIVNRRQKSDYVDWYVVETFDNPKTRANEFKYQCWWGIDTLPEFADNENGTDLHPAPRQYVMQATRRWMDPDGDGNPADGIDGWRLDVANEVPNLFWQDWNSMVREINPQAYTVAEIWDDAGDYLGDCGFSATMNYHGFAFPAKGFLIDGRMPAGKFVAELQARMQKHPKVVRYALQNLIDSHDTDRVASMIVNAAYQRPYHTPGRFDYDVGERVSPRWFPEYDVSRPNAQHRQIQRLVAFFQMTFVGAPMIYYGTEAGMDGGDDPDDRMPMLWDDLEYEPRTLSASGETIRAQPVAFDRKLFEYYQRLIKLRQENIALRRGEVRFVFSRDDAQSLGFLRTHDDQDLLVLINRGSSAAEIGIETSNWNLAISRLTLLQTSSGSSPKTVTIRDGKATIAIQPLSGQVWRIEP